MSAHRSTPVNRNQLGELPLMTHWGHAAPALSADLILHLPATLCLEFLEGKTQMDGHIRPYQPADDDSIIAVWFAASQIAHPFLTDEFLAREKRRMREVHLLNADIWVFERQAQTIGFVALIGDEVGAIFVHPGAQRVGIGHALMDMAVRRRGEVFLDVFKANWLGRAFYDRYGFSIEYEHIHEETGQPLLRLCYRGHGK